jgi:ankyrin repeat protein
VLHVAVVNDDTDMIRFLLDECEMNVNVVDEEGLTPVMFELTVAFGDIDLLRYFIENAEVDLNIRTKVKKQHVTHQPLLILFFAYFGV